MLNEMHSLCVNAGGTFAGMQRFRDCPVIFKSRVALYWWQHAWCCGVQLELQVVGLYCPYGIQLPMTPMFLNADWGWCGCWSIRCFWFRLNRDVLKGYWMCGEGWPITRQAGTGGSYGTRRGWMVKFTPGPFIPCTHCTGKWVGLGAGMDGSRKPGPHSDPTAFNKTLYWLRYPDCQSERQL